MHEPGPVTIGDLRRGAKALEIGCMNCDRHGPTPWRCLTCFRYLRGQPGSGAAGVVGA